MSKVRKYIFYIIPILSFIWREWVHVVKLKWNSLWNPHLKIFIFSETNVSRDGVKDEEEKVDMEFNKCNTNTQQCNCLDKKEETDNESKQTNESKLSALYYTDQTKTWSVI